jgi:hypothetical protein
VKRETYFPQILFLLGQNTFFFAGPGWQHIDTTRINRVGAWIIIVSTVCQGHGPSVAPSSSQKPPLYSNFGGMAINSNGSKCGKLSALAAT